MNRRKGFLLSLALALICSVLGAIGGTTVYWIREQPQLDIEPSAMVRFKGGVENYIPTPALQDLPGPLYVRSIIQSENKNYKKVKQ